LIISEPLTRRCIAVIPARGGSKRIANKNIRAFAGRPLIEYAIELAQTSGLFERIVVSTDAPEIKEVALRAGVDVPFVRPAHLADDHAPTSPVFHHALEAVGAGDEFDYACCIYPATPFTTADDLRQGLALLVDDGASSSMAVTTFAASVWRAFERREDNTLAMIWPEHRDTRSQDLPEAFHDAGQFYWVPVQQFLQDPVLFSAQTRGVVYERWRAHDIDTNEDWTHAEMIFRSIRKDQP